MPLLDNMGINQEQRPQLLIKSRSWQQQSLAKAPEDNRNHQPRPPLAPMAEARAWPNYTAAWYIAAIAIGFPGQ